MSAARSNRGRYRRAASMLRRAHADTPGWRGPSLIHHMVRTTPGSLSQAQELERGAQVLEKFLRSLD